MNILSNFGFDPKLFIAQIVNFVIILFILKKIMYKPVLDMLKKRDREIKKGIENAQAAELRLKEVEEREKVILQKANEKADKILGDAKAQASAMMTQSEIDAKAASERILEEARAKIAQETAEAEERLTKNIGRIAIALLEKSLTGIFGPKEQKTIIKKAEIQLDKIRT